MVSPSLHNLVFAIAATASMCALVAADEPREAATRPRLRTLELRVGRDKLIVPKDPEQKRQVEQFYRSLEEQAKLCVVPFQQQLESEAHFIGTICKFDEARRADLADRCHAIAQNALDRLVKAMFARRNHGNETVVVESVERVIPSGINELFLTSPREAARQELDKLLEGALSTDARTQLAAERERSATEARNADVLEQIAWLDEVLLLTTEQRGQFDRLLSAKWTDSWRRPNVVAPIFWGRKPSLPMMVSADIGGPFCIPDVEMTARLRPAQAAIAIDLRKLSAATLNRPNSANGVAKGTRTSLLDEQLLGVLIDDLAVACKLTAEQIAKLKWAGALAIERQRKLAAAEQKLADQRPHRLMTPAAQIALLSTMLNAEGSAYFKALASALTPAQRARLTASRVERQQFHERAMLASVIRKISDGAALTTAQREQLQEFLVARLADTRDAEPALGLRLGQLHRIIAIRPIGLEVAAGFRAIFDDVQWPLACEGWKSLERDLSSQEAARVLPPAAVQERAAGRGMF